MGGLKGVGGRNWVDDDVLFLNFLSVPDRQTDIQTDRPSKKVGSRGAFGPKNNKKHCIISKCIFIQLCIIMDTMKKGGRGKGGWVSI